MDRALCCTLSLGPGEPILTVLKQCIANKIDQIELIATDPSPQMLVLAEARLKEVNDRHLTVRFCINDQATGAHPYNVILSSLVVLYASDQGQMLRDLYGQLRENGLLISSHWSHPSQVLFRSVLKRAVMFVGTGERIELSKLESGDACFSLWSEEQTRKLYAIQGFKIQQWNTVDLPMPFPNIRTLLSFCRMAGWFNDPTQYAVVEAEVQRILRDDYHVEVQPNEPFALPSKAVVVVASK